VGEKFWSFGEKGGVHIQDRGLFFFGESGGFGEEEGTCDIFPFRVGVREVGSDIARTEGSENRIGESVEKDIGIGVPFEAPFVGYCDPAKDERASRNERMNIITKANAQHEWRMS
jgi:hypothetical protein